MLYTKEKKRLLGAFYTPDVLAELLARTVLSIAKYEKKKYIALDPAMGDGILLKYILDICVKKELDLSIFGIDIDKNAIDKSKREFCHCHMEHTFICTDAISPFKQSSPVNGWKKLSDKYFPNGIDLIVSNPPWGANKDNYINLQRYFETAKGQFDIYDLFIETSIRQLNEGGCYAFIVPDSIYEQEHKDTRKLLLEETTIKKIIRLGEGFFSNVNIAVTLIFGLKKKSRVYNVKCSHLSAEKRKNILCGRNNLIKSIKEIEHSVPANSMIEAGYNFLTDVEQRDMKLVNKLFHLEKLGDFVEAHRGIELSKKGNVLFCPQCKKWFPKPRKKDMEFVSCPNCGVSFESNKYKSDCIVTGEKGSKKISLITGEDIFRYVTKPKSFIKKGYTGINYKSDSLYKGDKIVIRKTGVGITAGIDYKECATNQVVYILKRKLDLNEHVTNEFILSILNSRIMTYFIVKIKGNNGWKTHPYLSQSEVLGLPFPNMDLTDNNVINKLDAISEQLKYYLHQNVESIPNEVDAKIEMAVANLYGLEEDDYKLIYETLNEVQQMIPFKRLLNIKIKDIFGYGL